MKLPETVQGGIFDLDGTLLDSLNAWRDVDEIFFRRRGLALPEDYFQAVKTLDLFEAAIFTKARFSLFEEPQAITEEWRALIREEYALRVKLKPNAKSFLKKLKEKGLSLAIATSSEEELFLPALKREEVLSYFSAIATTKEAKRGKRFPDVYLLAAKKLGLETRRCAVFEDVTLGLRTAKKAGFFTVGVFDPCGEEEEEHLRAESDLFLRSFSEEI